jgi:hypothetical protein
MSKTDKGKGFSHEPRNSEQVEWYTPAWVFEALGLHFDLDPCHPVERLPWVPANRVLTINDDGLSSAWDGLIWCNPPYGRFISPWLERMAKHKNGVALIFARTDCAWFHDYIGNADSILFLNRRIKFVDAQQVPSAGSPGSGSMLVAWGDEACSALRNMRSFGTLMGEVSP